MAKDSARLTANGNIVGWFQDKWRKSRALGNRSGFRRS